MNHDEEQIEMGLRDMLWQLEKAKAALVHAKMHERGHLIRILEAASDQFEVTQRAFGEERRLRLASANISACNLSAIALLSSSSSGKSTSVGRGGSLFIACAPSIRTASAIPANVVRVSASTSASAGI